MPWTPRRLRTKTLLSYVPALIVTIVAAVIVSRTFGLVVRYGDEVLESTRLIGSANALLSHMATAQSAVRGFALTGEDGYLDPYRDAEHELRQRRETLNDLWTRRPAQRETIEQALDLFFRWRDETAEPIVQATRPLGKEVVTLISRGRAHLIEANRLIQNVLLSERNLLQARSSQHESAARWGTVVAIAAPLIALTYVLLVSFLFIRRTVRSVENVSKAAQGFATGDFSRRADVQSNDELGELADTFNAMAGHLAERTRETKRLTELTQMLQVALSTTDVHRLFESLVPELLPLSGAHLYLREDTGRSFVLEGGWGASNPQSFASEACWAIRLGKPYRSTGRDGPPCEHLGDLDDLCSLCFPMIVQGESLGLIQYLYTPQVDEDYLKRVGLDVAERFAFTLANIRLRERLREQSIRDPLTGLYNRRYLDEMFDREIERARRFNQHLGLIMIDIDNFKKLNDVQGHDAGDAVLREFGNLLTSSFRTGDESYRFGGEEFLVLMPNAGTTEVLERAKNLREKLERLRAMTDGRTIGPITASMGISAFPDHGRSAPELLRAADQALYRAKEQGRDRIVTADDDSPRFDAPAP